MKKILNEKGMTLVEVILALAIFSIVFVVFINSMTLSNMNIFNQGNETTDIYLAQKLIDNAIYDVSKGIDGDYSDIEELYIEKRSNQNVDGVEGTIIEVKKTNDHSVVLSTFVPDDTELE